MLMALDATLNGLRAWRWLRRGHWEYWELRYSQPTRWRWMRLPSRYCSMQLGPWNDLDQSRPLRCETYSKENLHAHS